MGALHFLINFTANLKLLQKYRYFFLNWKFYTSIVFSSSHLLELERTHTLQIAIAPSSLFLVSAVGKTPLEKKGVAIIVNKRV